MPTFTRQLLIYKNNQNTATTISWPM